MAPTRSIPRCSPTTTVRATCTSAASTFETALQKYRDNAYDAGNEEPRDGEPALGPRIARLRADMLELDEPTREVQILDEQGRPLRADDHNRRYFEGPWLHKY